MQKSIAVLTCTLLLSLPLSYGADPAGNAAPPGQQTPTLLKQRKHFSEDFDLTPGLEITLRRYARFATKEGEVYFVRLFLVELHPRTIPLPPDLTPEQVKLRRGVPDTIMLLGHEIDVTEPEAFVPDFDVPANFVKPVRDAEFDLQIGVTTWRVHTVPRK
ncbi:MAG: hypothetical protein KDA90_14875 [Planctomycetaceae bacterium]|nr:hypothetical protein [Planctomycetaceae bacterium]